MGAPADFRGIQGHFKRYQGFQRVLEDTQARLRAFFDVSEGLKVLWSASGCIRGFPGELRGVLKDLRGVSGKPKGFQRIPGNRDDESTVNLELQPRKL